MNGYTIIRNAVFESYIWTNPAYLKFWIMLSMNARPVETEVNIRGTSLRVPPHTVCISVYRTGIRELSYKQTRTLLKNMQKSGYIRVYTKYKQTYIEIQDSPLYVYPKTTKPNTRKPATPQGATPEPPSNEPDLQTRKITEL